MVHDQQSRDAEPESEESRQEQDVSEQEPKSMNVRYAEDKTQQLHYATAAQSAPSPHTKAEIIPISRQVCSCLGLRHDRTVVAIAPTSAHACYARKRRFLPDVAHQRAFCLGGRFPTCPYYPLQADNKVISPYTLQAESGGRPNWLLWTISGVVIMVLIALAAVLGSVFVPDLRTMSLRDHFTIIPVRPTPGDSTVAVAAVAITATVSSTPTPPSTQVPGASNQNQPVDTDIAEDVTMPTASTSALEVQDSARSTPVPDGQQLALTPSQVDVGWWISGEGRQRNIGDSFLYAGILDQQIHVSAVRFDIRRVARGAPIENGTLRLTGLRDDLLDESSGISWLVQLLAEDALPELPSSDFETVLSAPASITLSPVLGANDVGADSVNEWTLDTNAREWLYQQVLDGATSMVVRIAPFTVMGDSIFAWDSGHGTETDGAAPTLLLNVGPPPPTPPPTPTLAVIVATLTPEPENVMTVVARVATATAMENSQGTMTPTAVTVVTPTPSPANLATVQAAALAEGLPPVILHTPVPANGATATANADYATAVALTTGTFTAVPTGYVTPILIYPSPPAENLATAAARSLAATAVSLDRVPTPTRSWNAVEAIYVYATPTPADFDEAAAQIEAQNQMAATTGTPTSTPWNLVVITRVPAPTPTAIPPIPLIVSADSISPTPSPTSTRIITTDDLAQFSGRILFLSDRSGRAEPWIMDPETGAVTDLITDLRMHEQAREQYLSFSPSRQERAVVRPGSNGELQIFVEDYEYDTVRQITDMTNDLGTISYDPAWSPLGNRIAFVSNITFGDEIYTTGVEGEGLERLTFNSWEWDKHPTWSPDGSQIAFFSNRQTGRRQIWIMNADGSDQRNLSPSEYNDWDPVWIP